MKNILKFSILSICFLGFVACESLDEKEVSTDTTVEERLDVTNEDIGEAIANPADGPDQDTAATEPME